MLEQVLLTGATAGRKHTLVQIYPGELQPVGRTEAGAVLKSSPWKNHGGAGEKFGDEGMSGCFNGFTAISYFPSPMHCSGWGEMDGLGMKKWHRDWEKNRIIGILIFCLYFSISKSVLLDNEWNSFSSSQVCFSYDGKWQMTNDLLIFI